MTVLWFVLGVLFMVVGVGFSIGWHEIGHLVPAKKFGVRVPQYMVGFGPTVWSRRRGETEYGIKAIPLGGYIRMIGMFPPRKGADPNQIRVSSTGRMSQLVDEARAASFEELRPGDENRVFYTLPTGKKIIVMLGGPVMNLILAVILLSGLVMAYGTAVEKPGAYVGQVSECVVPAGEATVDRVCGPEDPLTPAAQAGIMPGDVIVEIAGEPIVSNRDVSGLIRPRSGQATDIVVERAGERLTLTATPITNELPDVDAQGNPILDAGGDPVMVQTGFLGIASGTNSEIERQSPIVVPGMIWDMVSGTAEVVAKLPQKMVGVYNAAFSGEERDLESPVSVVGVGRIAGEVASGQIAFFETPGEKLATLVLLLAGLNIALFVFNLIPLLPLDGGHVAGAIWEGIKKGYARARGLPDPGPVDVAKALPLAYGVSILLIGMALLLIYADIVNPIRLG
ncbi:MAG: site-2 protease family protein [Intrasporangiaceae bacterium]|mgnify:FL=1|nr:site-2 protease family protein [Intrasporangiaceae bacterium]